MQNQRVTDARSLAVELVDGIRGYTCEFSTFPEQHKADYDLVEEKLLEAGVRPSSAEEKAVEVKMLEWSNNWGIVKAETPIGHYYIEARRDGSFDCRLENMWSWWASSSETAKATSQADYERRIRSALVDVPAVESEPVAWTSQDQLDDANSSGLGYLYAGAWKPEKAAIPLYAHPPRSSLIQSEERWRPIETAPHETNVLLAWPDSTLPGGWKMEAGMASWGWRRDGVSNMSSHGSATHWQPLPTPPSPYGGDNGDGAATGTKEISDV